MTRSRRWASGLVMAIAAVASVATSRARWHLDAALPPGAPTHTATGGDQAIVLAVEATGEPDVTCSLGGDRLDLVAHHAGSGDAQVVHAQYVCPPGGTLEAVVLSGNGGGGGACSKSTPPDDVFLRVTRLAAVPVWTRTSDATLELRPSEYDATTLELTVEVRAAAGQPVLTAALAPEVDGAAVSGLRVMPLAVRRYELTANALKKDVGAVHVHLSAVEYGACPSAAPCQPPAGDGPAITGVP